MSSGALLGKVLQPKNYYGRLTRSQIFYSSTGAPFEKSGFPRKHKFSGHRKITYFCCAAGKTTLQAVDAQPICVWFYGKPFRKDVAIPKRLQTVDAQTFV